MKNIVAILILAFLIQSCDNASLAPGHMQLNQPTSIEIKDTAAYVRDFVINYYKKVDSVNSRLVIDSSGEIYPDEIDLQLVSKVFDSSLEKYSVWEDHHFNYHHFLMYGDLNNDQKNDVIAMVYSNELGSYEWTDIFLFTTQKNKLEFVRMYRSDELGKCSFKGAPSTFIPTNIENGILMGKTYCYKEGDPNCCPSLKFHTEYKFKDSLILKDQGEIDTD